MDQKREKLVTIFGGSGFIGRHLVRHLAAQGYRVRVAVRDTGKAAFLKVAGRVGQISFVPASVTNEASVKAAVEGADAVVNLVGILFERRKRTFRAIHEDGAANVAKAAKAAGAKHLVQLSALGAGDGSPSSYARSKAAGEKAVKEAFPGATILRPSVVFGPEDGFFNLFGRLAQLLPAVPYFTDVNPQDEGGGGPCFQPVYVGDVVEAIAAALAGEKYSGHAYELVGPRVYDMREIVQIASKESGRNRHVIGVPFVLVNIGAHLSHALHKFRDTVLPFIPFWAPFITPDQVIQLKQGNVGAGAPGLEVFGIVPTAVEAIVPTYLRRYGSLQQTKRLRLKPRGGD